ncbi:YceI family protein [Ornithinimicrobium pekingense]|uniref:Polyisoprenoid-binding protein n=1 Tax=Ornithinimicrobium pekingense TaxID=384677 RepID=A0ABQ2FCT0_9MICO|nr:YceI family protein [Ornithinimicrobium pekingense]GGK81943.1 polyisoprenoid-binding protein [Ornithinimicrobium pekingense]
MPDIDPALSGTWVFDPGHTRVGFSARHAMVTTVRGTFTDVSGVIVLDAGDLASSSVEVRLSAASITTNNAQRDEHLRSPDFFDVETYPDITFRSSTVDEVDQDSFMVVGDLTIRDVTRQVAIPIALLGVQRDQLGNLRAGFEATRRLDRRDFGLHWNMPLDAGGLLISEKVTLEFEISAIKQEA